MKDRPWIIRTTDQFGNRSSIRYWGRMNFDAEWVDDFEKAYEYHDETDALRHALDLANDREPTRLLGLKPDYLHVIPKPLTDDERIEMYEEERELLHGDNVIPV